MAKPGKPENSSEPQLTDLFPNGFILDWDDDECECVPKKKPEPPATPRVAFASVRASASAISETRFLISFMRSLISRRIRTTP
jgi:hypothetical protein